MGAIQAAFDRLSKANVEARKAIEQLGAVSSTLSALPRMMSVHFVYGPETYSAIVTDCQYDQIAALIRTNPGPSVLLNLIIKLRGIILRASGRSIYLVTYVLSKCAEPAPECERRAEGEYACVVGLGCCTYTVDNQDKMECLTEEECHAKDYKDWNPNAQQCPGD